MFYILGGIFQIDTRVLPMLLDHLPLKFKSKAFFEDHDLSFLPLFLSVT